MLAPGKCAINVSCPIALAPLLFGTGDEDAKMVEDMGVEMGRQEIWDDLGFPFPSSPLFP